MGRATTSPATKSTRCGRNASRPSCNTSTRDTVVLLGYPRTLTDAITFEASVCHFKHCIVFESNELIAEPTTASAKAAQERFLMEVNPIAAYYEALDACTRVNLDDAKTSPVAAVRSVLESLARR
jgi:hypothetical protein